MKQTRKRNKRTSRKVGGIPLPEKAKYVLKILEILTTTNAVIQKMFSSDKNKERLAKLIEEVHTTFIDKSKTFLAVLERSDDQSAYSKYSAAYDRFDTNLTHFMEYIIPRKYSISFIDPLILEREKVLDLMTLMESE